VYLPDYAWPDVDFEGSTALVPLGSTEQHGPHLPLATDHLIAEGFARAAAERTGFVRTPTVRIGVSPHHRQFPGTLWVDPPEFRDYVESVARNLTYHGVDRMVFVNAHGGNVEHLREVGRRLRDSGTAYACEWMWDRSIPELVAESFDTNGPHAGPKETSLIQYLHPELVHEDRIAAAAEGGCTDLESAGHIRNGAQVHYDAVENSHNGAFGDQTDASAEAGEKLFEAAADRLVELAEWLDDKPFDELTPRERR
jgi:creatinine amidohydrolase